ncbi:hypothetical protein EPUS_03245 [Endocarpon pusillum Z07020]|uniref:Uncharacterized protein n=1 Tax=Endocarpon pusillum (strain Z07020 / HMAS-L-300199) TaxID=1263415 RepID=U1GS89_ENDPU|nr:uncharacterized protein EPUS_03245 [Endocarpon pusillum Z07020]ERF74861.1 hypothetical protein EPUS_03245 [Endocarpon pusillum Z07020]
MSSGRPSYKTRSGAVSTRPGWYIDSADSPDRDPWAWAHEHLACWEPRSSTRAESAPAGSAPNIPGRVHQRIVGLDATSAAERAQQRPLDSYASSLPERISERPLNPYATPWQPPNPYATPWQSLPDRSPTNAQDGRERIATSGFGSPIELLDHRERQLQRSFSSGTPSRNHSDIPDSSPGPASPLPKVLNAVQVRSLGPQPTRQRDQPRPAPIDGHSDSRNEAKADSGSARAPPPGFPERVSHKSFASLRSTAAASPPTRRQPQLSVGPIPSLMTVSASVTGPGMSKGVSQQSINPRPSVKAGSGLAGAGTDFSEKMLQRSIESLPLASTGSLRPREPPGFPERDPRRFFPPYTSPMEGSASARSHSHIPEPTQPWCLRPLPTATRIQPCLVPITIHPDASNIAAVRRLINQYTHRIKGSEEGKLRNQRAIQKLMAAIDNTEILCNTRLRGREELPALLQEPSQVEERRLLARQALLQREREDMIFEQRISSLEARRGRLLDVLSLRSCASEFRTRMKLTLEYLLSIPDTFDPNVPDVDWDNYDRFEG